MVESERDVSAFEFVKYSEQGATIIRMTGLEMCFNISSATSSKLHLLYHIFLFVFLEIDLVFCASAIDGHLL